MSIIIDGTSGITATGSLTGLTTPLSTAQGGTGLTTVGTSGQALVSNGSAITWGSAGTSTNGMRVRSLVNGTTYTVPSDVKSFYVFVYGAVGGRATNAFGGVGGPGYSEKYYASPSASYSYSLGAAGSSAGGAGGTTTFDTISITGSGGISGSGGSSGGTASGGDFNANGGSGGSGASTSVVGGAGGAGSRAGVGGNGAANSGSTSGGTGGTGGNNASGGNGGNGATAKAVGALTLPFNDAQEWFQNGGNGSPGQQGASGWVSFDTSSITLMFNNFGGVGIPLNGNAWSVNTNASNAGYPTAISGGSSSLVGSPAFIQILEILK